MNYEHETKIEMHFNYNGDYYCFAITESNGTVTTQYYIIGEKKYCLIQETNYDKSEECDDATMEAVNSFTW